MGLSTLNGLSHESIQHVAPYMIKRQASQPIHRLPLLEAVVPPGVIPFFFVWCFFPTVVYCHRPLPLRLYQSSASPLPFSYHASFLFSPIELQIQA